MQLGLGVSFTWIAEHILGNWTWTNSEQLIEIQQSHQSEYSWNMGILNTIETPMAALRIFFSIETLSLALQRGL